EQDGVRFRSTAEIRKGSRVRVPSAMLRVHVEPRVPGTLLTVASLETPPNALHSESAGPAPAFTPIYRGSDHYPLPGRRIAASEDVALRVPRGGAGILAWAAAKG